MVNRKSGSSNQSGNENSETSAKQRNKLEVASGSQVKIRVFQEADKEQVRDLARRLHGKTVFGHFPFSDAKFDRHAETVLKKQLHMVCLVAEFGEEIIGFAWATTGRHTISEEGMLTTCHVIAVDLDRVGGVRKSKINKGSTMGDVTRRASTFLRLLKGIKDWSKNRGAEHVLVHVTTGVVEDGANAETTGRLLRKIGAQTIGGAYLI